MAVSQLQGFPTIRPVILSGGSGTRLWPLSQHHCPKQFAPLVGEACLFNRTLQRIADRDHFAPPLILGCAEHHPILQSKLREENRTDATLILEPVGRNTAAAALVAAFHESGGSPYLHLVMPSDHAITDPESFYRAVQRAMPAAAQGHIVLFGMTPSYPETGYGYILAGEALPWTGVQQIATFREKPDEASARALIEQGALWNSGIFLYAPETLKDEILRLSPDYYHTCLDAFQKSLKDKSGCVFLDSAAYAALESHPFDKLVMERTQQGAVVPYSMGWSDVGSWQGLWQSEDKDSDENAITGPVVSHDTTHTYLRSDGLPLAVLGVHDLAVVATTNGVLVAPLSRSQEVRTLANKLQASPRPAFHAKSLFIPAGVRISHFSSPQTRHWLVAAGTVTAESDGATRFLQPHDHLLIPARTIWSLENKGESQAHLIEVQWDEGEAQKAP